MRDFAVTCIAVLLSVAAGCDRKSSSSAGGGGGKTNADELFPGRKVEEFVADKSLPDDAVIKAYVLRRPGAPLLFPQGKDKWATVEPSKSGGYLLWIERLDPVSVARTYRGADFDPLQAERDGVKYAAEFCRDVLKDLQPRNLKGIGYKYIGEAKADPNGKQEYMTMFRVSVMPEDLPNLAKAVGAASAGSVFDPRADRIKEIFAIDENLYPQIEYTKKTK